MQHGLLIGCGHVRSTNLDLATQTCVSPTNSSHITISKDAVDTKLRITSSILSSPLLTRRQAALHIADADAIIGCLNQVNVANQLCVCLFKRSFDIDLCGDRLHAFGACCVHAECVLTAPKDIVGRIAQIVVNGFAVTIRLVRILPRIDKHFRRISNDAACDAIVVELTSRLIKRDASQQACADCALDAFNVAVVELHATPSPAECGTELAGAYLATRDTRHASISNCSSSWSRTIARSIASCIPFVPGNKSTNSSPSS